MVTTFYLSLVLWKYSGLSKDKYPERGDLVRKVYVKSDED
jgi:hypothetical protein